MSQEQELQEDTATLVDPGVGRGIYIYSVEPTGDDVLCHPPVVKEFLHCFSLCLPRSLFRRRDAKDLAALLLDQ